MDFVRQSVKSVLAFLGVFIGQLLARVNETGTPVFPNVNPVDWPAWLTLLGWSFVAAVGIYFARNSMTLGQVDQSLEKGDFSLPQLHDAIGGVKPGDGVGGSR